MTVVNPKSISGINSITTGSGSDNLLTIHTSDASSTERVRINSDGDVIVGSGITVSPDGDIFTTGVTTATTFVGALTGNVTGNVTGTLQTAAQANITSLGTLTGLAVNGNITLSDSIIHLDDTNTKIQFPSNDTISFSTNASEKLRIDSDGRLLSGATSSSSSVRGVFRGFAGDGGAGQGIIHLEVNKTTTNCGNGENLGSIRFGSNEGHIGALIGAQAESAWSSSSDLPSYINFYTCPDGSNTLTERLRIDSSGRFSLGRTSQITVASNTSDSVFDQLTSASYPLALHSAQTTKRGLAIFYADTGAGNNGDPYIICQNQTSTKFQITADGDIFSTGGIHLNGDTTDSNKLDDYEEGSWTPSIRNEGTTANWNSQTGKYVKIGQQVTVWFNADGGSDPRSGGSSSSLIMTGLPFSQSMFSNPILGVVGANKSSGTGLYSTSGLILNGFGQGGTQVRFGCGGQAINFSISYVAGCLTYTAAS